MASSQRDDFSPLVKRTLAERVAWICSFPECGQNTAGPNLESPEKSINNGFAAHITSASPGGKRYDKNLSPEQRSGIANGIWMCGHHGSLIDKEELVYDPVVIRGWKMEAEDRARRSLEARGSGSLSAQHGSTSGRSAKDLRILEAYAEALPFSYIQRLKQEPFGRVVQHAITDPLYMVLDMLENPKFIFQDKQLEALRQTLNSRVAEFFRQFGQHSAGLPQYYEYIDVAAFSRDGKIPRKYWEGEVEKTQRLATLVAETALSILTIREDA